MTALTASAQNYRSNVIYLQEKIREEMNVLIPEVKHHFAPGTYARETTMPAGFFGIGKIHKHAHLNIVSKGFVTVFTEDGRTDIRAPFTFVSTPGTKRSMLAHEETVWTTVHATDLTDIDALERELVADSYEELLKLA